jgi:hypothetical protein
MVGLAREGWNKVRGLLEGEKIVRVDGRVLLKEDNEAGNLGGVEMEEWNENSEGGVVEIEEKVVGGE